MSFVLNMAERYVVCEDFYAKHPERPHVGVPRSRNIVALGHELWGKPSGVPICEGLSDFNLARIVSGPVEKTCILLIPLQPGHSRNLQDMRDRLWKARHLSIVVHEILKGGRAYELVPTPRKSPWMIPRECRYSVAGGL